MAYANNTQILIDTTKRVVVKRVGIFDTAGGAELENVILEPLKLNGVLDANGNIYTTGNTLPSGFANNCLSLYRVVYSIDSEVGHVQLRWQGTSTTVTALALGQGNGDTNPQSNLPTIKNNAIGPTGNITLLSAGTTANAAYTLIMEFHKDNRYFSAGQDRDPAAFNAPPYGVRP